MFRPKTEKKLFELLQIVSAQNLSLDSVLFDCPKCNVENDNCFYKPSVDALMYNLFRVYDVSKTARKEYYQDWRGDIKSEPRSNIVVKDYIKYLAAVIAEDRRWFLSYFDNVVKDTECLREAWSLLQREGKSVYNLLSKEFRVGENDWYAYGYPEFSNIQFVAFEQRLVGLLGLSIERPEGFVFRNISTVVAYHLSRLVD